MAVSKIGIDGKYLINLENDTAVAGDVDSGLTFHLADGSIATGTDTGGYAVMPVSNDTSMGTVSGGGVTKGSITVVATPINGSKFTNWTINGTEVSTNASYTFTPSSNTLIVANFDTLEIVSWVNGDAAKIKDMIDAHYAGSIDLHNYWSLGDTRRIVLPAMDDEYVGETHPSQGCHFVLMDSSCTGFTLTGTSNKPAFIVGMKECMDETGYMNPTNNNTSGWSGSARRNWCNITFKNAMESVMPNIFKQFTWKQGKGGASTSGLLTTNDYFALPPEKAVFGSRSYSYSDEAALYSQWNWYQTSSNRIKTVWPSNSYWWEASSVSGNNNFCIVSSGGDADNTSASNNYGIAPFGCI